MTASIHTPARWARYLVFLSAAIGVNILAPQAAYAASFTVNIFSDSIDADLNNAACADNNGNCSLRAAIQQANATPGKDTITLPLGTISLSIVGRNEDAAATGDLDITDSVDILGNGGNSTGGVNYTTISAGVLATRDRVFHLASGNPTVTLTGLIITNGLTEENSNATIFNGAGVLIDSGTVTINDCRIQNNTVTGTTADFFTTLGGGIHVGPNGTLTLSNSTVSSNTALAGGGLSNQGTTNIRSNTFITSNSAAKGGGGGIANLGGYLNVGQATIDHNIANLGGGIYNEPQNGNNGTTNTIGAAIEFNTAQQILGQDPNNPGGAQIAIGGIGGGVFNLGPMTLQRSAVNENQTKDVNGTAVGYDAGGIYNSGLGNIDIANVTISKNVSRGGGGIFTTRNVTLTNVTIFNNKAMPCTLGVGNCDARGATGGNELSVYNTNPGVAPNNPDVVITNSILADGTYSNNNQVNGAAVGVCAGSAGYAAYIASNGYNISGDASCDLTAGSDRTNLNNNTNPSLQIDETLQVNAPGTTTKTHQLLAGSPAIDAIPSNVANPCPLIDQRNLLRNLCDIGAYEYNAGTAAGNTYVDLKTTVTDRYDPATVNQQNTYTITVTNLYDAIDVNNAILTINVPAQLRLNTVKPANSCSFANYTLTCSLGLIAAQDKKQVFIDVTPTVAGTITVTAIVDIPVSSGQIDAFVANNTASQTTEIKGAGDGSTNFGGTGGGGTIGALLWLAVAGWSWRRFPPNSIDTAIGLRT
ncbi:MAG: hypothetical protein HY272_13050 [Gammaproteobacteria bacterium]|nr:hypothetical protein [Gammaproteobacteria bacterium]